MLSRKTAALLSLLLIAASCGEKGPEAVPGGEDDAKIVVSSDPWDGVKRADISYQILIYSFADSNGDGIGDFRGIEEKLGYLDELGVSALWLSPAHPAEAYHGYGVKDYMSLNPDYGTEADFKSLIDSAHEHGIKIYMDYVVNHTAKSHPWFSEAVSSADSEYRDYYVLSEDPSADIAAGRIPMISSEGSAGYDPGQWFPAVSGASASQKIRFTLDWTGTNPYLTAEEVDEVVNEGQQTSGKYLYYGSNDNTVQFYTTDIKDVYSLSLDIQSSWGVLVVTQVSGGKPTWAAGTKYGAPSSNRQLVWGQKLKLSSSDAQDILLPDMKMLQYHSHFWTASFADLNYGPSSRCAESPAFQAVVKSAQKWIDMGVDGFRLDGAKHVYHNASSVENPVFWNTFYTTLNGYFRQSRSSDIYMVGEVFSDYGEAAPYYKGLPALFDFAFWYRVRDAINGSSGSDLASKLLKQQAAYASNRADFIDATKLTNHDETRAGTEFGADMAKMKMAGAILLTSSGSPYIYYGEELGYLGDKNKGDQYVRNPMKWGDSHTTTFMKSVDPAMSSVKDASAQASDGQSMLSFYREFAQLRNMYPALAHGSMSEHKSLNASNQNYKQVAAWYMTEGSQRLLVIHNLSSNGISLTLTDDIDKAVASLGTVGGTTTGTRTSLRMEGWSSVVFLLK